MEICPVVMAVTRRGAGSEWHSPFTSSSCHLPSTPGIATGFTCLSHHLHLRGKSDNIPSLKGNRWDRFSLSSPWCTRPCCRQQRRTTLNKKSHFWKLKKPRLPPKLLHFIGDSKHKGKLSVQSLSIQCDPYRWVRVYRHKEIL